MISHHKMEPRKLRVPKCQNLHQEFSCGSNCIRRSCKGGGLCALTLRYHCCCCPRLSLPCVYAKESALIAHLSLSTWR